jgi:hypothetical protein
VARSRHTPVFLFENDYYFLFSDDLMRAIHRKSIIFVQTNYTMHVIHTENTYEKLLFQKNKKKDMLGAGLLDRADY